MGESTNLRVTFATEDFSCGRPNAVRSGRREATTQEIGVGDSNTFFERSAGAEALF